MELQDTITSFALHKNSFVDTGASELKKIIEEHPAFGAAQLFYTKKIKEKDNALFLEHAPKTALRFGNIFWLNYLLSDIESDIKYTEEEPASLQEENSETDLAGNEKIIEKKLSAMLASQAKDFAKPANPDDSLAIDTEPLYKKDYFASQGISLIQSQDAFGKKVKKFTEWLKDIKKASPGAPQLNTTEEEEKRAAAQATASLKIEEVVTEPMAEVLAQQGKKAQAVDLYKKLSLIYPEKSAYFAAKINSLQ
ncbi:MAG: hypothetical protein PW786_09535 [Arachidicoccus sp.]|nr:hypothetical protein [Arachidicoccus sp.]